MRHSLELLDCVTALVLRVFFMKVAYRNASMVPKVSILGSYSPLMNLNLICLNSFLMDAGIITS